MKKNVPSEWNCECFHVTFTNLFSHILSIIILIYPIDNDDIKSSKRHFT